MKKILSILICISFLFSCRVQESVTPDNSLNKATVLYDGKQIDFNQMKIEEEYLDTDDSRLGIRTFGEINDSKEDKYYWLILDFIKISSNNYSLHKINLGIRTKIGANVSEQQLYFIYPNKAQDIFDNKLFYNKGSDKLIGIFNGSLYQSQNQKVKIAVSGSYELLLKTISSY